MNGPLDYFSDVFENVETFLLNQVVCAEPPFSIYIKTGIPTIAQEFMTSILCAYSMPHIAFPADTLTKT